MNITNVAGQCPLCGASFIGSHACSTVVTAGNSSLTGVASFAADEKELLRKRLAEAEALLKRCHNVDFTGHESIADDIARFLEPSA